MSFLMFVTPKSTPLRDFASFESSRIIIGRRVWHVSWSERRCA